MTLMPLKPLRINWDADKNKKLLARYQELQLIPLSCGLEEIIKPDSEPRKEMSKIPPHTQIIKYKQSLITSNNCLCIKMGSKLDGDF
jgi:hypothetical protein